MKSTTDNGVAGRNMMELLKWTKSALPVEGIRRRRRGKKQASVFKTRRRNEVTRSINQVYVVSWPLIYLAVIPSKSVVGSWNGNERELCGRHGWLSFCEEK